MSGSGSSDGRGIRDRFNLREAADALFASSAVVDLLIVFCHEPERRFYVNELIKLTGLFPRLVQLALARLDAAGLVHSERQANARFYRIAVEHPFFPDLRAIVAKVQDHRTVLRQALAELPGVRVAFLRPAEADATDLDVVVVGDLSRAAVDEALAPIGRRLRREIRTQVFSPNDWTREARRQRSFVHWLLEEAREYLVGGDEDLPAQGTSR